MELPEVILACLVIAVVLGAIVADVYLLGWIVRKLRGTRGARGGDCR